MDNTHNFCIISHSDHSKNIWGDRLLEQTGIVTDKNL